MWIKVYPVASFAMEDTNIHTEKEANNSQKALIESYRYLNLLSKSWLAVYFEVLLYQ